jgi:hypothetical protein
MLTSYYINKKRVIVTNKKGKLRSKYNVNPEEYANEGIIEYFYLFILEIRERLINKS